MRLPFAVFPLVRFTSDPIKMGEFVNSRWLKALAYLVAAIIAALNGWLLVQVFTQGGLDLQAHSHGGREFGIRHRDRRSRRQACAGVPIVRRNDPRGRRLGGAKHPQQLSLRESDEMKEDRAYIDRLAASLEQQGLRVEAVLASGNPGDDRCVWRRRVNSVI